MIHRTLLLTISFAATMLAAACTSSVDLTSPPPGATQPPNEVTAPAPGSAPLGESFQIGLDQPTLIEGTDLTVTFQGVAEDSRCPADVVCEWAGQATVEVSVSQGGRAPDTLSLTDTENYGGSSSAQAAGYVIHLVKVSPYPQKMGETIPLTAYSVTLVVASEPPPASSSATLGEPFHIGIDQSTAIEGTDLTVTFQDVVEDSRCPLDVDCVWSGQAVVRLGIAPGGQEVGVVELTTEAGEEDTATVGTDYVITLLAVSPYPQTVEKEIPLSDYTISLMVSRSGAN